MAGMDAPSNGTFTVTQTNGTVSWRQTFGTILSNHGGTLDIETASGTTRCGIEVSQQANGETNLVRSLFFLVKFYLS